MAEMKLSWLIERNLKDMDGASPEEISSKVAEIVNKESFVKPANVVPFDPRINKIEDEIVKTGIKPGMMRRASSQMPYTSLKRCLKTPSSICEGVSEAGVMRALRTATGGTMLPKLMRAVSSNVTSTVTTTTKVEESPGEQANLEVIPEFLLPPPLLRSRVE